MSQEGDSSSRTPTRSAKEERAFAIIARGLDNNYLHNISDLELCVEAWHKLDVLFGARSYNSTLSLKVTFFELHMKLEESIAAHVNTMRSLMTQLASAHSPVTVS